MKLEKTKCPICNLSDEKSLFTIQNFQLVKCRKCYLVYLNPRPKRQDLGKFYPHDYYGKGGKFKRILERWLTGLSNLRRRLVIYRYKKGGKILDLGCGTGEFLQVFSQKKWKRYGVEPNPLGYEIAVKKQGVKLYSEELINCCFPSNHFDVITAWHVLEHVYNLEETLDEIERILKNDGILFLSTPNLGGVGFKISGKHWFHLDIPRHLFLFNQQSLREILNLSGFKIIRTNFPFLEYPLDLFHSILGAKFKNEFLKAIFIFPLFLLLLTIKPVFSLLNVGETMEVVCVKEKKKNI